jgi:hypothetical protein
VCTGLWVIVEVVRRVALCDAGYIEWHMYYYTVHYSYVKEIVYFLSFVLLSVNLVFV